MRLTKLLKGSIDLPFLLPVTLLITVGLVMLYSIGLSNPQSDLANFYKQLWFVPVLIVVYLIFINVDYRWYYFSANIFYALAFSLLLLVLFFGTTFRGTTGWFQLGGIIWQPVEMVKILWIVWLSYYFTKIDYRSYPLRAIVVSFAALMGLVILIMKQPDLGSASILLVSWVVILLLVRIPWKYLFSLALILSILVVFAWIFIMADYQKDRVTIFLNPHSDPLGSGYNVRQSIIAVGSGKLFGRGVAQGTQSQLRFLPESQTDFIFAVIGEEFGFIGIVAVVLFWTILFWRIYHIAVRTTDNFASLLSAGILAWLASQVLINMGMNVGLLPITGLGLPLVSYGRSSLLAVVIALAIITNISRSTSPSKAYYEGEISNY